ncbi:MAG: hypothetical protein KC477_06055, partial [Oceanospirillaceae bacterium]|nr:hypothetical protein [Oceanospirillaceae bacterium]
SVMNYTQLGVDADDEMHQELAQVVEMVDRRMFALVNKFDQKGANTDDEVATRKRVVQLAPFFSEDMVFPVSSRQAYWANAARGVIDSDGALPDYNQHPWVKDFASAVFGGFRWEDQLADVERVKQASDYLWKESKFSAPLEQVIVSAYNRVGVMALESASVRLLETAAALKAFLSQRSSVLNESIEELQPKIKRLQQSIDQLSDNERKTRQQLDETLTKAEREAEKVFGTVKKQALKKVDGYFKEGKRLEIKKRIGPKEAKRLELKKRIERKKNESNKGANSPPKPEIEDVISRMWETLSTSNASDFDPAEKKFSYDTRKEAKARLTMIGRSVEKILKQGQETIELSASEVLLKIENELTAGAQREAEELLKELEQQLGTDDLVLNISIPEIAGCIKSKLSMSELMNDVVSKNTEMKTSWYRSSGVWGTVCDWFNSSDWGWDSYTEEVTQFEVDLSKVRNRYAKAIDKAFEELADKLLEQIRKSVEQGINDFYMQISDAVKQVQGNYQQGLRDHQRTQEEKLKIIDILERLNRHLPDYKKDIEALQVELEELSNLKKEAA